MTRWLWYINITLIVLALITIAAGTGLTSNGNSDATVTRVKINADESGQAILDSMNDSDRVSPLIAAVQKYSRRWEPPMGAVTVTITPNEVLEENPQWRLGNRPWQDSGMTISPIPAGKQTISFKPLEKWNHPKPITVEVARNKTATASAEYSLKPPPEYGSVSIVLEPQEIIDAGGQWRVGTGVWHNSGETEENILVGNITISFKAVEGWNLPKTIAAKIEKDQTSTQTATYVIKPPPEYGSVSVTIEPENAIKAGAQWKIVGGEWQDSGATLTDVLVGNYTIDFKTVEKWTPANKIQISVENEQTASASGIYKAIKPAPPKFRVNGTLAMGDKSIAWIKIGSSNDIQAFLIGDVIQEYKLIGVANGYITVDREGYEYTVEVEASTNEPTPPPVAPQATPKPAGPSRPPTRITRPSRTTRPSINRRSLRPGMDDEDDDLNMDEDDEI